MAQAQQPGGFEPQLAVDGQPGPAVAGPGDEHAARVARSARAARVARPGGRETSTGADSTSRGKGSAPSRWPASPGVPVQASAWAGSRVSARGSCGPLFGHPGLQVGGKLRALGGVQRPGVGAPVQHLRQAGTADVDQHADARGAQQHRRGHRRPARRPPRRPLPGSGIDRAHPLVAPSVRPETNCFCSRKKTIRVGIATTTDPAATRLLSVKNCPRRLFSELVIGNLFPD